MTALTRKLPKAIDETQALFRLKKRSDAEALVQTWPMKDAIHYYLNRCLSSRNASKPLPAWQEVDEYLHEKRMSVVGMTLEEYVGVDCFQRPYEVLPHASLFALRVMNFIQSKEGRRFDVESDRDFERDHPEFDRTVRATKLLCILVKCDRHKPEWNKECSRH